MKECMTGRSSRTQRCSLGRSWHNYLSMPYRVLGYLYTGPVRLPAAMSSRSLAR